MLSRGMKDADSERGGGVDSWYCFFFVQGSVIGVLRSVFSARREQTRSCGGVGEQNKKSIKIVGWMLLGWLEKKE
jgi:hypothetical protein